MFEPPDFDYAVPFDGDGAGALDVARTALLSLGFEIERDTARELVASGPGMRSNRQPELMGATSIRFEIGPGEIAVHAELGGVATMKTFVYLFPPLLTGGLLLMGLFQNPDLSPFHVSWVLLWAPVAWPMGRALERNTTEAVGRLLRGMAQAGSRKPG